MKNMKTLITVSLNNDFNFIENPIFLESKTQQGKVGYHAITIDL